MTFDEAIKELLAGKTIWRMNYDGFYDEVLRDEISFDGEKISLRKIRVTYGPDFSRREKVLYESQNAEGLTTYPEELAATDWRVKDDTYSAEEALQAFREGKWIRHKTREVFIRKDASDPNVYQRFYEYPPGSGMKIGNEDMTWFAVRDLFFLKDGWIISDKERPT